MKNLKRIIFGFFVVAFIAAGFALAKPAFAEVLTDAELFGGGLTGPEFAALAGLGGGDIRVIIARIIRAVLTFLGIIAVCIILYGGFLYMFSQGERNKVEKAKKVIINGVIGLVIVLASFSIAQFIITSLVTAINQGGSTTSCIGPECGGGCPGCTSPESFYFKGYNDACAEYIKNIQLNFVFSHNLDASTVENGILIQPKDGTPIQGDYVVDGNTVTFRPATPCDAPYTSERCFVQDQTYEVELVREVLKDTAGNGLDCLVDYPCDVPDFTPGSGIDANPPTDVHYQTPLIWVTTGRTEPLQVIAVDDVGVSDVYFRVDGGFIDHAGIADSTEEQLYQDNNFRGDWITTGYVWGRTYELTARAVDCAGHQLISPSNVVTMRGPNCNNGIQDPGDPYYELGVDCSETPADPNDPPDYYCGQCPGAPCTVDADCAGQCVNGVCVGTTVIEDISPGSGTEGNLITISGTGFGTNPGTLTMISKNPEGADFSLAPYSTAFCTNSWTDTQVVFQVPAIPSLEQRYAFEIINADTTQSDRSDDGFGLIFRDFYDDETVRPGMCLIDPTFANEGDDVTMTVHGLNFDSTPSDSSLYFIKYPNSYQANGYLNWDASGQRFDALVPLLYSGIYKAQVFVGTTPNREGSNTLDFTVNSVAGADTPPTISFIDTGVKFCSGGASPPVVCGSDSDCTSPQTCGETDQSVISGPAGQYVTIYGSNFGSSEGQVWFDDPNDLVDATSGNKDFPPQCPVNFWSDSQILIKVPDGLTADVLHELWVVRVGSTVASSNKVDFYPLAGDAGPSICAIDPIAGPPGTEFEIYGERFGFSSDASSVEFYNNKRIFISNPDLAWDDEEISGKVPADAETGEVFATNKAGYRSNSINFEVGVCDVDFPCAAGTECCGDGACRAVCTPTTPQSFYTYWFSTGPIPAVPHILYRCRDQLGNTVSPFSPVPWDGYVGGNVACTNSSVQVVFDTAMEPLPFGNPNNIKVEECGDNSCTPNLRVRVNSDSTMPILANTSFGTNSQVTWAPSANYDASTPGQTLKPNTQYIVTFFRLNNGQEVGAIKSKSTPAGGLMNEDFIWTFRTGDSPCDVSDVDVSPAEWIARELINETPPPPLLPYVSTPLATQDGRCEALNCSGFSWAWDSSDDTKSRILNPNSCQAYATAEMETYPNPVYISSTENRSGLSDQGTLIIDFTDPEVVDYFPNCNEACWEIIPWAKFNTAMTLATFEEDRTKMYKCTNELCDTLTAGNKLTVTPSLVDQDTKLNISLTDPTSLTANTYYRVLISGDVESHSGVKLSKSGTNYPADDPQYFSWVFRTKEDNEGCEIDRIEVQPEEYTFRYVGERAEFNSFAYGAPDECDPNGQLLAVDDWHPWTEGTPDIMALHEDGEILRDLTMLPAWCSTQCLKTGSLPQQAVCGNGISCTFGNDTECQAVFGSDSKCNRLGQCVEFGEDCDDGNTAGDDGCSEICLAEGIEACVTYDQGNCCGNGVINQAGGYREECDDGFHCEDGRACTVGADCAGIGDGLCKKRSGTGCSAVCLNEGSRAAGSTCDEYLSWEPGRGGEDCTDNNTASGDGCSSVCLNEGSGSAPYAVCGDGVVASGEDCDNGKHCIDGTTPCTGEADCSAFGSTSCEPRGGDGCSANCLNEGSSLNCKGDGSVNAGEDADNGSEGLSSSCLNKGSSYLYTPPSVCGDRSAIGTNLSIGEECETTGTPTQAPYAIAVINNQAPGEVNEITHLVTSTLIAEAGLDNVQGSAELTLECSCTPGVDETCGMATVSTIGCGRANCCFPRPNKLSEYPQSGAMDVCRNTAITGVFDQVMDPGSFVSGSGDHLISLSLLGWDFDHDATIDETATAANCPEPYEFMSYGSQENKPSKNMFVRAWQWLSSGVKKVFIGTSLAVTATNLCEVPLTFEVTPYSNGPITDGSKIHILYQDLLEEDGVYMLMAEGKTGIFGKGVRSIYGVETWSTGTLVFEVGSEICELEYVGVEDMGQTCSSPFCDPSPEHYSTSGEVHNLVATPYTLKGAIQEQIQPTSIYDWDWSWQSTDAIGNTLTVADANSVTTTGTSGVDNGFYSAIATATFTVDQLHQAPAESVVGQSIDNDVDQTVFICENPWPPNPDDFPFIDSKDGGENGAIRLTEPWTQFGFQYCRDDRGLGMLPELDVVQVPSSPNTDIVKEILFLVDGENDAIGVRVIPNVEYLPIDVWYDRQDFTVAASPAELDGFKALASGTTTYASAASRFGHKVRPYVYVVSYNDDASEISMAIINQVLDNWRFHANTDTVSDNNVCFAVSQGMIDSTANTSANSYPVDKVNGTMFSCDWDEDCASLTHSDGQVETFATYYCDADKAKLRRDQQRLADMREIEFALEAYGSRNRHCSVTKGQACTTDQSCPGDEVCVDTVPEIASGSFIRATTTSTWPSWASELGNALGTALPVDPINQYVDCPADADQTYCWNDMDSTFKCNKGSHTYIYQSIGGEAYKLFAQLEYNKKNWAHPIETDTADNGDLHAEYALSTEIGFYSSSGSFACKGTTIGDSEICGDGARGVNEVCELGETISGEALGLGNCHVCVNFDDPAVDGIKRCAGPGDTMTCQGTSTLGIPGEDYFCATGTDVYACANIGGTCAWDTNTPSACTPFLCGNGVIEPGEDCDDGVLNGTYGYCGSNCSRFGGDAFYCGDGTLAGGEQCDCGLDISSKNAGSWSSVAANCVVPNGQYTADPEKSCAFDCTRPGPTCGDEIINGNEICDGDFQSHAGPLCGAADNFEPCNTQNDCPNSTCGATAACPVDNICIGGDEAGTTCNNDNDCLPNSGDNMGVCSDQTYQTYRTRSCKPFGDANACDWGPNHDGWSACLGGAQACGNGITEGNEQCDDGNQSNSDDCTNYCKFNVCGDNFRYVGVESCDSGNLNGAECTADYGDTCVYCSNSCTFTTVNGAFCGDSIIDSEELCDLASIQAECFSPGTTVDIRDNAAGYCTSNADCGSYSCYGDGDNYYVGICNGGSRISNGEVVDFNGVRCAGHAFSPTGSSLNCGDDGATTSQGECVKPQCSGDCESSCPPSYLQIPVFIRSEAEAEPQVSTDLYSFDSGSSPRVADIFIPACEVGVGLTANVDMSNVIPPKVAIVFLTDTSKSMPWCVDGTDKCTWANQNRRIDYTVAALIDALDELYDEYDLLGHPENLYIALFHFDWRDHDGNDLIDSDTIEAAPAHDDHGSEHHAADGSISGDGLGNNDAFKKSDRKIEMQGMVQQYADVNGKMKNNTATHNGISTAADALHYSDFNDFDRKIVVMLTDGDPTYEADHTTVCSGDRSECLKEIRQVIDSPVNSDIEFYSATIADGSALRGKGAHMSSEVCGKLAPNPADYNTWDWDSVADCNQGNYAFFASTADEIAVMFDRIVDSILGVRVDYTTNFGGTPTLSGGYVRDGVRRILPFPLGFECNKEDEFPIPFRINFASQGGDSMVNIGGINLSFCPAD